MSMVAILLNGADLVSECPKWNLVTIGQAGSEKTFKDDTILYVYSLGARADNNRETIVWLLQKRLTNLIINCKFQPLVFHTFYYQYKMPLRDIIIYLTCLVTYVTQL